MRVLAIDQGTLATWDVAVIGAGVVGAAIAREASRHQLSVVLFEAGPDVGAGTSRANTAILHTGFDAKSGSLEARLVRRGAELRCSTPSRPRSSVQAWSRDQPEHTPADRPVGQAGRSERCEGTMRPIARPITDR